MWHLIEKTTEIRHKVIEISTMIKETKQPPLLVAKAHNALFVIC